MILLLSTFANDHPDQMSDYDRARIYALQGNVEDAMDSFMRGDKARKWEFGLAETLWLEPDVLLKILHEDSRYIEVMKRRHDELDRQLASWKKLMQDEGWEDQSNRQD